MSYIKKGIIKKDLDVRKLSMIVLKTEGCIENIAK